MRIAPFRGYRHGGRARDLTPVVAPPYDQISPPMQEALYAMSPDNIVRVSFPRDADDDKYPRARETLDRWLAEGVWGREGVPAIYPYHQTYRVGSASVTRAGCGRSAVSSGSAPRPRSAPTAAGWPCGPANRPSRAAP